MTAAPAPAAAPAAPAARPVVPADVKEVFLAATPGTGATDLPARIATTVRLHYVQARAGLDAWRSMALVAPLDDDGTPLWAEAREAADLAGGSDPLDGAAFAEPAAAALRARSYADAQKSLKAHVYQHGTIEVLWSADLKLTSNPGESEGDFRARLAHALHEHRDQEVESCAKSTRPNCAVRKTSCAAPRSGSSASSRSTRSASSTPSYRSAPRCWARSSAAAASAARAGTAARSAGRVFSEKGDVERAGESLELLTQRRDELAREIETEVAALQATLDPAAVTFERISVAPRKSDIAIGDVLLAWEPWRQGADGFPQPAWQA